MSLFTNNIDLQPYQTALGDCDGWELVFDADHTKGSWRSIIQAYYREYAFRKVHQHRKAMSFNEEMEEELGGYFSFKNASMICKKDTEELLMNTVSPSIDLDLDALQSSSLGLINDEDQFTTTVFIPVHSTDL